jgi:alcohol dehydrogenase
MFGNELAGKKPAERKELLLHSLSAFYQSIGFQGCLSDIGVTKEHIIKLTEKAMKDACMVTNPRTACMDDIIMIYESAL